MNKECQYFIEEIIRLSPGLTRVHEETLDYWKDPSDTIVFGAIGTAVIEEFESYDDATKQTIMTIIENGMASANTTLVTAVATGLIEAMIGTAERMEIIDKILPEFGKLSRFHADAWMGPWGTD